MLRTRAAACALFVFQRGNARGAALRAKRSKLAPRASPRPISARCGALPFPARAEVQNGRGAIGAIVCALSSMPHVPPAELSSVTLDSSATSLGPGARRAASGAVLCAFPAFALAVARRACGALSLARAAPDRSRAAFYGRAARARVPSAGRAAAFGPRLRFWTPARGCCPFCSSLPKLKGPRPC